MTNIIIIFFLFNINFKNIININSYLISILILSNYWFLNISQHIDVFYVYILNQLIDLNLNTLLLFLLTSLLLTYFKFYYTRWINLSIVFVLINYINSFVDSTTINYTINPNLINGLFIIHPILIYIYYTFCILIVIYLIWSYNLNYLKYNNILMYNFISLNITKFNINKLFIVLTAISLGSLWAYQELTWGTWWNWDLIEITNLIYLIYLVGLNHENKLYLKKNYIYIYIYNLLLVTILFISIRYSLIQSIHNFLNVQMQNQFNIYVYMFIVFISYLTQTKNLIFLKNYKKLNFWVYIYMSFIFLMVTNILNNLFHYNVQNLTVYTQNISLLVVFIFLLIYFIRDLTNLNFKGFFQFIAIPLTYLFNIRYIYSHFREHKLLHINLLIIVFLILFFFFQIKLHNIYVIIKSNLILNIQDSNYVLNKQLFNNLNITNYIQSSFFLNLNLSQNLHDYISYNTQQSNLTYFLPNWDEFNGLFKNKYLFAYINIYLYLIAILINPLNYSCYFIRKIYY